MPATPNPSSEVASRWRREPYRVFFPLGAILAGVGVLPWLWFALGWSPRWRPVFHSITEIEGFLTCLAVGFLFTAMPRRTGTAPPSTAEMWIGLIGPIVVSVAAWFEAFAIAQLAWLAVLVMLGVFVIRRSTARTATRRPPDSFVWIPASVMMAVAGSVLLSLYGAGVVGFEFHQFGKLLALQGLFVGLVIGVGGLALPLLTRGESARDQRPETRWVRIAHVAAAGLLVTTFAIEAFASQRVGHAIRGALVLFALLATGGIWRRPCKPGIHRWLIWLAAWAIPSGYALAALVPDRPHVGLHVVFVLGFAMMALSVGLHVSLAHGGRQDLVERSPWRAIVFGGFMLLGGVARAFAALDPGRLQLWLGIATGAILLAIAFWMGLAIFATRDVRRAGSLPAGSTSD